MHAVVVGAGPSGVLACINLIRLGWKVTLLEKEQDISEMEKSRIKSWMIGIAKTGEDALRDVPGLWEHVESTVIRNTAFELHIFGRKMLLDARPSIVDRNYFVCKLLNFLLGIKESTDSLKYKFETKILFVDGKKKQIYYQKGEDGEIESLGYDLLVGADGARSVVRNSLFSQDPNFECSQSPIFQSIKSIYIPCPPGIEWDHFYGCPNAVKGANLVMMSAPHGQMNFIISTVDTQLMDDDMLSNDPDVLFQYMSTHLPSFIKIDRQVCSLFAQAKWYRSQQVTCMPYHIEPESGAAILLGDAAHAGNPSIGMGMNIALQDSHVLYELMIEHQHDLSKVLSEFSERRVKVGRAFTDLGASNVMIDPSQALWMELRHAFRKLASYLTGGYVKPPIRESITEGIALDEVYVIAKEQKVFELVRARNNEIMRTFKDQMVGLVPHTKESLKAYQQLQSLRLNDIASLKHAKNNKDQEIYSYESIFPNV